MEYTFIKDSFDAYALLKEIEAATALKLSGEGQDGYISTYGNKIKVVLSGPGSAVLKNTIQATIINHIKPAPPDLKAEYAALLTDAERMNYIAKKMGLV